MVFLHLPLPWSICSTTLFSQVHVAKYLLSVKKNKVFSGEMGQTTGEKSEQGIHGSGQSLPNLVWVCATRKASSALRNLEWSLQVNHHTIFSYFPRQPQPSGGKNSRESRMPYTTREENPCQSPRIINLSSFKTSWKH